MSTLGAVEAAFKRYLLNGDASIASTVASSPKLGATHRLEIYGNAYRARLTEALASDYPILRSALGEERFRELCSRYIAVHPSRSFTLRDYGACLPRFIAAGALPADAAPWAELTHLEWAFVDAFDASDAPAANATVVAQVDTLAWPGIEIDPQPSVRVVDLHYNTLAVRQAVIEHDRPPAFARAGAAGACFVWRRELTTFFRAIDATERAAWLVLCRGETFAAMCDELSRTLEPGAVPLRAATYLHSWLQDGLISRVRLGPVGADASPRSSTEIEDI